MGNTANDILSTISFRISNSLCCYLVAAICYIVLAALCVDTQEVSSLKSAHICCVLVAFVLQWTRNFSRFIFRWVGLSLHVRCVARKLILSWRKIDLSSLFYSILAVLVTISLFSKALKIDISLSTALIE